VEPQGIRHKLTTTPLSLGAGARLVKRKPAPYRDLTGQQFGRLLVINRAEHHPGKATRWACVCNCKAKTKCTVNGPSLTRGSTRSCGCLRRESTRARRLTHGKTYTAEWWAWINARARCANPKNPMYRWYGGRSITVQPEWDRRGGFTAFMSHIGEMPQPGMTLERINNDLGYIVDNVTWADRHAQNRNKRGLRWIEGLGSKKILTDWAEYLGVTPNKLSTALLRFGELLFATMALRPSLIGMQSLEERQAELDATERARKEGEEAASFVVETV
jgi:hypothetical protein